MCKIFVCMHAEVTRHTLRTILKQNATIERARSRDAVFLDLTESKIANRRRQGHEALAVKRVLSVGILLHYGEAPLKTTF